jgi:hypothetical protein
MSTGSYELNIRKCFLCLLVCMSHMLSACDNHKIPTGNRNHAEISSAPKGFQLDKERTVPGDAGKGMAIINGWLVRNGCVIWGYAQHNGWWGAYRTNITRREPGRTGPGLTEDLDKLTDAMLRFGYPGFEHNFGLWYDRRRDAHDVVRRTDAGVVSPFLEQPWSRSGTGTAWDGLPKYDLERFNPWYFERLREFANYSDTKGTVLIFNFYMQHALLEYKPHYVDFPWRPANAIQETGMPGDIPAANVFYDITHSERRRLHRLYIFKCLDELGAYSNVIFLPGQEFTGPLSFVQFWMDTIEEWEAQNGRNVVIGLGATKDVMDYVLQDPRRGPNVSVIDLRYWWYLPDGSLHAPPGGREIAGRYAGGFQSAKTTAEQIYRQVREYRDAFPDRAILHTINANRQQMWAFLMGGGSLLISPLEYPVIPGSEPGTLPQEYIAPGPKELMQPPYDFINTYLATELPRTLPASGLVSNPERNWCLADPGHTYLVYMLRGGALELDLSGVSGTLTAYWLDPAGEALLPVNGHQVVAGKVVQFVAPDQHDWLLWLTDTQH